MSLAASLQLTSDQKESFVQNGFLRLPKLLSPEFIRELSQATDRLCDLGENLPQAVVIWGNDDQKYVIGIEKMVSLQEPVFRELLGSPLLLSIAQTICGSDFFPVQDFIVIKNRGDENEVKWHQDILTEPLSKTIMVGFYLDPATDQNGALRVVPGSHKSGLPICELEKMDYTSIEMEAGDVLVHDLMLAHSSGKLTDFPLRRVVYFEFMSAKQAIAEQVYPEIFVETRTELIPLAIRCFSKTYPQEKAFIPEQEMNFPFAENPDERIREIYEVLHHTHIANYCFEQFGM